LNRTIAKGLEEVVKYGKFERPKAESAILKVVRPAALQAKNETPRLQKF
jgi:hypothetical protein